MINMSLGFVGSSDPLLHAALARAAATGVLSVASAGNTTTDGVYYPASDENVISVGVTDGCKPLSRTFKTATTLQGQTLNAQASKAQSVR